MNKKDIIFLGSPGAGKGTQVDILKSRLACPVFIAGAELRAEKKSGSELGKKIASFIDQGHNVLPKMIIDIAERFVLEHKDEQIIFDDIPRSSEQKVLFDAMMKREGKDFIVINLTVDEDKARKRMSGRIDGRKDDDPEVINERFRVYHNYVDPVIETYEKEGRIIRINGDKHVEEVAQSIQTQLKQI